MGRVTKQLPLSYARDNEVRRGGRWQGIGLRWRGAKCGRLEIRAWSGLERSTMNAPRVPLTRTPGGQRLAAHTPHSSTRTPVTVRAFATPGGSWSLVKVRQMPSASAADHGSRRAPTTRRMPSQPQGRARLPRRPTAPATSPLPRAAVSRWQGAGLPARWS